MRNVIATTVTVVTLSGWAADRIRTECALAHERRRYRDELAKQREQHRRELRAADRRRQADIATALTDPITGFPTRRAWEPIASARLRSPAELALLDLDGFKHVNDTYGHLVGDQLLRLVAARLRQALGPDAVLGRAGGDEIVIATQPDVDWDRVLAIVTAETRFPSAPVVRVGASIGVVRTADLGDAPALVRALSLADEAMYAAKRSGGGWRTATAPHGHVALMPQIA